MTLNTQQDAIIQSLLSWEHTKFKHQGRLKRTRKHKGGVDCIGLVVGVCADLELKTRNDSGVLVPLASYDQPNYSREPSRDQLQKALEHYCQPVDVEDMRVGDILLFTLNQWPQHAGIIFQSDANGIQFMHASEPVGWVIRSRFDLSWRKRLVAAYRFPSCAAKDS